MTDRLQDLPDTLTAFSRGHIGVDELARAWREAAYAHEPALPERYVTVLERVLNRWKAPPSSPKRVAPSARPTWPRRWVIGWPKPGR
jgi:hypothetical protein